MKKAEEKTDIVRSIRISGELNSALSEIAEEERRTYNNLVKIILEDYVKDYKKKHSKK